MKKKYIKPTADDVKPCLKSGVLGGEIGFNDGISIGGRPEDSLGNEGFFEEEEPENIWDTWGAKDDKDENI